MFARMFTEALRFGAMDLEGNVSLILLDTKQRKCFPLFTTSDYSARKCRARPAWWRWWSDCESKLDHGAPHALVVGSQTWCRIRRDERRPPRAERKQSR